MRESRRRLATACGWSAIVTSLWLATSVALSAPINPPADPSNSSEPNGGNLSPAVSQLLKNWPMAAGHFRLGQLVHYRGHHGRIAIEFTLPAELEKELAAALTHEAGVRVAIDGSSHLWTLERRASPATGGERVRPGDEPYTELSCYDGNGSGPFQYVRVLSAGAITSVLGQDLSPVAGRGRNRFSLIQREDKILLNVRVPPARSVRGQFADLGAFATEQPAAYHQYFLSIARELGMSHLLHQHAAADVYRVFDQIQPDDATQQQVERHVDLANSADFNERQRAAEQLRELGRRAVLVMMRLDRDALWPEQQTCVDRLLREDDWGRVGDVAAAKDDLNFLLDCLDDDDLAVRQAAKAAVSAKLQTTLNFDLNLAPEARAMAVDDLCDQAEKGAQLSEHVKALEP